MLRSLYILLIACCALALPAAAQTPAKQLFGAAKRAAALNPAAHGSYAKGCIGGAVELPENGPTWQAVRLSRNRNWGHPEMIAFLQRLSRKAASYGWSGLYIGDISQPRGGPMLTGHRSHQIGLDADIWMKPALNLGLSRAERETLAAVSIRTSDQRNVNENWTWTHHRILRAAAEDPAVARIFLTAAAKVRMCADTPPNDRQWLRKIRPWSGHHYHFHVRLSCPRSSSSCINQPPPPPGDGCREAATWIEDTLKPPDPNAPKTTPKPRRAITLADLPKQCARVLSR